MKMGGAPCYGYPARPLSQSGETQSAHTRNLLQLGASLCGYFLHVELAKMSLESGRLDHTLASMSDDAL